MAKPNQKRRDEGTIIEATEAGLGLDTPTSDLQPPTSDLQPPTSDLQPPIPNPQSPSVVDQLPDKRIRYDGKKPGEIVLSLSKEDLDQRSLKQILAVCPVHNTACVSTSTASIYTHVGCPVKGCKFTLKVVRPTVAQKLHKLPKPQQDISRGRIPG